MKRKQFLLLLALLMTAATGAWAQSTTYEIKAATIGNVFNADGTLNAAVKDGDVLDFQEDISISQSLIISKKLPILSTKTPDKAVVCLNTVAGSMMGDDPGNSFVINKAASGTTVEGIRFDNTQLWIYNTSNVTFTGVTFHVEGGRVGAGVGHVAIRYSDNITLDGCTVYSKNCSGSGCTLTGSSNCTFKDTRFEGEGTIGNLLYLCNPSNTNDKPDDFEMACNDCKVLNCTIAKADAAIPICMFIVGGLRHHIEGCTIENLSVSPGWGTTTPTSVDEGLTFLNNTFICSTTIPKYSTAENNTVTGTFTLYEGATATGNSVTGDVTVSTGATATGNTITGAVTASGADAIVKENTITGDITLSSTNITVTGNIVQGKLTTGNKTATITGNSITSTEEYAVYLNSTAADANNTVTNNNLKSATKAGDAAVYIKKPEANTVSDNYVAYNVKMADGTMDAANWSTTPAEAMTIGVTEGQSVTLKYTGRLKVKSVTATFEPDPMLATPLTIEALTAGTIQVNMTAELKTGMKYSVNGGDKVTIQTTTTIDGLKAGDKVQFYGNGTKTQYYGFFPEVSIQGSGDGFQTKVYGNIMSLLDETGFATMTDLPDDSYVFYGLFLRNTTLIDASELLLPAKTLADCCYRQMFEGCTNLTTAPKLPTATLAFGCYKQMFQGCTSLTTAPKLPTTTLAEQCYYGMFSGCTSLTSAYVKAAYTVENDECRDMFDGCSASGAVLHTTSDNKPSWQAKMGAGNTWPTWSVADDWQD